MAEITLKGGHTTTDPRLDRIPFQDPQSRNYTVRELLTSHGRTAERRRRNILPGATLDQGQMGACTGFSITHAAESSPWRKKGLSDQTAIQWYYDNQKNDADPGGEYPGASPHYAGSSVLASMKTLVQLGIISEYRWIGAGSQTVIADLQETLRYLGPVCFGTNWYNSMFDPQPNGLIEVDTTSGLAGGHAYCVHDWLYKKLPGTDKAHDYLLFQQSWGPGWGTSWKGQGGFAYVKVEDALALLSEDGGEGAVPINLKYSSAKAPAQAQEPAAEPAPEQPSVAEPSEPQEASADATQQPTSE